MPTSWALASALTILLSCGSTPDGHGPLADYDVSVEVRNTTPEAKTDWPVVMTVYRVFGRNLPDGTLNPNGYHVFDPDGVEVAHSIEAIPPYDQEGNNELIWVIPAIEPGETLTYRITNTRENSEKRAAIDVVGSAHNLIGNGGFESSSGGEVDGWTGDGALDDTIKRTGRSSLRLRGTSLQELQLSSKVPLNQGSRYYFGAWGKTDEVSRHGIFTSKGGHFTLTGFDSGFRGAWKDWQGKLTPLEELRGHAKDVMTRFFNATPHAQCYTRDWAKTHFNVMSYSDWGLPEMTATAAADTSEITLALDQRPQFVRPADQEGTWWVDDVVLIEQPETTVRFDRLLEPHIEDGLFVIERPTSMNLGYTFTEDRRSNPYCSMPYPREQVRELDRFGLKGQRVVFLLGVYHTRPIDAFRLELDGGELTGPDGQSLPLTEVEWLPGFLGPQKFHLLREHTAPVGFTEARGLPYFLLSFEVPREADPGRYSGTVKLLSGDATLRSFPIAIRVQDMEMPELRDVSVGAILQSDPLDDETMRQYVKSNFNGINLGGARFEYITGEDGKKHVDLEAFGKLLDWLVSYDITSRVTLWGDADLGPQWGGGRLIKTVNHDEEAFKEEVRRVEEYVQANPNWPRLIWMTWDEPTPDGHFGPRGHGRPTAKMGWTLEAVPNSLNTVDASFYVWDKILPYHSLPNLDEPADYAGPEIYAYTKAHDRPFGFAGAKNDLDERVRYQVGMMLIGSGAINFQYWHLSVHGKLMDRVDDKLLRSISMAAMGEGMDDLRIHRLLTDSIEGARQSGDPDRRACADEAEEYLKGIHSVWNADHRQDESYPYLGLATDWGYDQFYQDWQNRMARYAARCSGIPWVE